MHGDRREIGSVGRWGEGKGMAERRQSSRSGLKALLGRRDPEINQIDRHLWD